ncbi:28 kDa ribonucleoprotein, chloroplastic isoform X2 [Rhododendron vialii]|uniref:28 kDa ribonucleoprotein, chloroplastic isoform X2 n=1 Tax=Rhododendron vialii TaxID=182163 RepID=UPI00265ECA47|nr:28 kDa ribonucleoprotein, chloroplastic isoform X2 [Rhododendron vialii]
MVVIVSAAATTIAPESNLWTMATLSFTPPPSSSLSSLSSSLPPSSHRPILSCFLSPSHSLSKSHSSRPFSSSSSLIWYTLPNKSRSTSFSTLALVDQQEPLVDEQEPFAAADPIGDDDSRDDGSVPDNNTLLKPCELDVCNLPRSFGTAELEDLFKPHGTVQSVEISRNAETGISRGCGTVTMSSIGEAKDAIAALDGSDVGEREMRVKFKAMKPFYQKNSQIYEAPYRIYVGNLAWRAKPEDLKSHFSKFGTVNSAKVLYDRKDGKNRCYGFLSFSSPAESKAAASLSGTEFLGRTMLIREVEQKIEP